MVFLPVHVNTLEVLRLEYKDELHMKDKMNVRNCTAWYLGALLLHRDVSTMETN
jgi:hypothetical protein